MSDFKLPPGFRFHPKDFQIIGYLVSEINGDRIPGTDGLIFQADVFGEVPPWDLFSNTNADADIDDVRFFFTFLKKITKTGSNFKRTVGNIGTWKGENRGVPIVFPKTRRVIGEKKSYSFWLDDKKQQDDGPRKQRRRRQDHGDCRWLMTEYSTHLSGKDKKSRSDYVICRIKKKKLHQDNPENNNAGTSTPPVFGHGFEQYILSHFNLDIPKIISDTQIPVLVEDGHTASPETESVELPPNHNNLITLYHPSQECSMNANDYSYVQPGLEKNTCALQTNPQMCADENGSIQVPLSVGGEFHCSDDFGVGKLDAHLHQTAIQEDIPVNHYSSQLFDVENIEEFFQDVNMDDLTSDKSWQDELIISADQDNLISAVTEDGPATSTPPVFGHGFEQYILSHFNLDIPKLISDTQIPVLVEDGHTASPETESVELQPNHNNLTTLYQPSQEYSMNANDYSYVQPGLEKNTCALQTNPQMCADENGSIQVPLSVGGEFHCNDDFGVGKLDNHLHETAIQEDIPVNHYSSQLFDVENFEEFFQDVNMHDLTWDKSWQDELITSTDQDNLISAVTEDGPVDYGLWCF